MIFGLLCTFWRLSNILSKNMWTLKKSSEFTTQLVIAFYVSLHLCKFRPMDWNSWRAGEKGGDALESRVRILPPYGCGWHGRIIYDSGYSDFSEQIIHVTDAASWIHAPKTYPLMSFDSIPCWTYSKPAVHFWLYSKLAVHFWLNLALLKVTWSNKLSTGTVFCKIWFGSAFLVKCKFSDRSAHTEAFTSSSSILIASKPYNFIFI